MVIHALWAGLWVSSCFEKMSQPCGSFYGTPVSTAPDDGGIFMTPSPTDRFPSRHMPGFTPVSWSRNDGAINEKLDKLLSTVKEQKQENAQFRNTLEELSSQLSILKDQVSSDTSSSGSGRFRVPPALSVSCCTVVCFTLMVSSIV